MCWSRSVAPDALGFDARRIAILADSGMLEQKRSKKVCGENVLPLLIVVASDKWPFLLRNWVIPFIAFARN